MPVGALAGEGRIMKGIQDLGLNFSRQAEVKASRWNSTNKGGWGCIVAKTVGRGPTQIPRAQGSKVLEARYVINISGENSRSQSCNSSGEACADTIFRMCVNLQQA